MRAAQKHALACAVAAALGTSLLPATALAGSLTFGGRTWTTNDPDGSNPPSYGVVGDSGTMTGNYGGGAVNDAVMATPVTITVGSMISYDYQLTNAGSNWVGDSYGDFRGGSIVDNTNSTGYLISGRVGYQNDYQADRALRFQNAGFTTDPRTYSATEDTPGIHVRWTFPTSNSYFISVTNIGEATPIATYTGSTGGNPVTDISFFRQGLFDSLQTVTLSNFYQYAATPAPSGNTFAWNAASGSYNTGANWNPGGPATLADNALIANNGTAIVNTSGANAAGAVDLAIGNNSGNGTLNVVTGGELLVADLLVLGTESGTGTVNQTGGLVRLLDDGADDLRIGGQTSGVDAGAHGEYNFYGGEIMVGDSFTIGQRGTGVLNMFGGLVSQAGFIGVANNVGSQGTFNMSGGTINQTFGDFEFGDEGIGTGTISGGTINMPAGGWRFSVGNRSTGTGTVTINGTAIINTDNFTVGKAGNGTATLDGSAKINARSSVTVGHDAGGIGLFTMNGGEIHDDDDFLIGNFGTGTFTMNGGLISGAGWIVMGNNPGSNGTFNLTGGTVNQTFGDIEIGDEAPGAINLIGGTINMASGGWGFFVGNRAAGTGTATINGAATLNTDKFTVGKAGNGTATVAGSVDINTKELSIGNDTGGIGLLHFNGGDINVANGGDFFVGNAGNGTLDMTGGVVSACGWIVIGKQPGSQGTFNMSGGTINQSEGDLEIGNGGNGTLNLSGGALNITGTVFTSMPAGGTGAANVSGGALSAQALLNNGTFAASGASVTTLGTNSGSGFIDGTGSMTVGGTATVNATHLRQASLTMTGGTINIAASGGASSGVSIVDSVNITAGKLNLADNKLITKTAVGSWNGSNYGGVLGLVKSGRNGGAWNGSGIVTSMSDAAGPAALTTLAVASADELGRVGSTFGGVTLASGDTMVMYTYGGDADLSGDIDADDYFQIDSHYNKFSNSAKSYSNGDFNYDGQINGDDYFIIDANFVAQDVVFSSAVTSAGVSAVPEPTGAILMLIASAGLSRRRRA